MTNEVFKVSEDEAAPHEAAHAVVAYRSGIPVVYVEIRRQLVRDPKKMPSLKLLPKGTVGVALGFTSHGSTLRDLWRIRDTPEGRTGLQRYATVALAGVVADRIKYGSPFEDQSHADDVQRFYDVAGYLGMTEWAEVRAFGDECLQRASDLLVSVDGGQAWREVTGALIERRTLTQREVSEIVEGKAARTPERIRA